MYLPNATSTYAYNPPVKDTRLPAIAKQVTNRTIAIAQHTNASGDADPSPCASVCGAKNCPSAMECRSRGQVAHRCASPAHLLLPLRQPCREWCCIRLRETRTTEAGQER